MTNPELPEQHLLITQPIFWQCKQRFSRLHNGYIHTLCIYYLAEREKTFAAGLVTGALASVELVYILS